MATSICGFCDHVNPAGAGFCNACGSALRLRPCAECDAINDVDARSCHHCGHALEARFVVPATAASTVGYPALASPASPVSADAGAEGRDVLRTPPPSPADLASAADRLDAFWRASMHAAGIAPGPDSGDRAVPAAAARVDDDSPRMPTRDGAPPAEERSRTATVGVVAMMALVAAAAFYGWLRVQSVRETVAPEVAVATPTARDVVAASAEPASPAGTLSASDTAATGTASVASPSTAADTSSASSPSTTGGGAVSDAVEPANARAELAAEATPEVTPQPSTTAAPADADATTADASPTPAAVGAPTSVPEITPSNVAADATSVGRVTPARPSSSAARSHTAARSRTAARNGSARTRATSPTRRVDTTEHSRPATAATAAALPEKPSGLANVRCTDSVAALGLCARPASGGP
ncbi:MAG: zinc ribbon domain-containing protein [Betaproteobacteria bacterium]